MSKLKTACPKPDKAPTRPRRFGSSLPVGEKTPRKARKALKSSGRIKAKPRTKAESERIYGTPEHIAWMKAKPCAFCGIVGYSAVAHTRNGGLSKKADWEHTVPACENVPVYGFRMLVGYTIREIRPGCHDKFDKNKKSWRAKYDTDALAAKYAAEFRQSHVAVHPERK